MKRETVHRKSSIDRFFEELESLAVLSREEQQALARRARQGDIEARNRLWLSNVRFAVSIAKGYFGDDRDLNAEWLSCAIVGLFDAIERFDPERGTRVTSYSVHRIRREIQSGIAQFGRPVGMPYAQWQNVQNAKRTRERLEKDAGRPVAYEDVTEAMDLSDEIALALIGQLADVVRFDDPMGGSGTNRTRSLHEVMADPNALTPAEEFEASQRKAFVLRLLTHLTKREREVVGQYCGLDGRSPKTFQEIGNSIGVTRAGAQHMFHTAIEKLRAIVRKRYRLSVTSSNGCRNSNGLRRSRHR